MKRVNDEYEEEGDVVPSEESVAGVAEAAPPAEDAEVEGSDA